MFFFTPGNSSCVIVGDDNYYKDITGPVDIKKISADQILISKPGFSLQVNTADIDDINGDSPAGTTEEIISQLRAVFPNAGGSGGFSTQFQTLGGTEWNYTVSPKMRIILTENTELTLVNVENGDTGLLDVMQDSAGGWTLTINGIAIPINEDADSYTGVAFYAPNDTDIRFFGRADATNITEWQDLDLNYGNLIELGDKKWSGTDGMNWGNYGRFSTPFTGDITVACQITADTTVFTVIGLDRDPGGITPNMYCGVQWNSPTSISRNSLGASAGIVVSGVVVGSWVGAQRKASTGITKMMYSLDKITWVPIYTISETETGPIYGFVDVYNEAVLANPQFIEKVFI